MFFGTGRTSSVSHAAGAPGGGVNARPNALVVLVNTNAETPAAVASSSRLSVPVMLASMNSCRVSRDVRFVQGGGVNHGTGTRYAPLDEVAVGHRTDVGGEGRYHPINAHDLIRHVLQAANKALAQVPAAARDHNLHAAISDIRASAAEQYAHRPSCQHDNVQMRVDCARSASDGHSAQPRAFAFIQVG